MPTATLEKRKKTRLWSKPITNRAIKIPKGDKMPFLLHFAKKPDIKDPLIINPIAGNTTYIGQTPTPQGDKLDFINDDQ